jgi:hypothetical protein
MAGPYALLPTLRSHFRGGLRADRERRGLLLLHRSGLSPHTPCRFPAHSLTLRPAHSRGYRISSPPASDISSPPCLPRLLPAGALAGWALHPLEKRAALSRRTPEADFTRPWLQVQGTPRSNGILTMGPLIEPQFRPFLLLHGYPLNSWFGARTWRFRGKSAIDRARMGFTDAPG